MAASSTSMTGSVGSVETQYVDLPEPVRLDCGRDLHPVRVAYETYGVLSPERDNVILVCHALSGDAHGRGVPDAARREHSRRVRRRGTRWHGSQGTGLVGRDDRPRQGVRHRPVLRGLHQPPRRLPRHHRSVVDRSGNRPAVRRGLPGDHRRRHGAHRARLPRRPRRRATEGSGGRRFTRRHAGAAVGGPVPRPGRCGRRDRQHARPPPAGHARPGTPSPGSRSCATRPGRTGSTTARIAGPTPGWAWPAWSAT